MKGKDVVFRLTRRDLQWSLLVLAVLLALFVGQQSSAQKAQDDYGDKFKISSETGNVAITTSADGKYVYVAGDKGVLVSDDHGTTGSWTQTLKLK